MTLLLTTKLYLPLRQRRWVARSRLIERLNAELLRSGGFARKLTLVSAPAGYGKTALVSDWLRGLECPVAWVSLDENDNDPVLLLSYMIAALQQVAPGFGQDVQAMVQSPQPPPTPTLLAALLNEIATLPRPVILALDDYHVIQSPRIHEQVAFLLDHLPPQMHLVLMTREDPLLPISRLRVRGHLMEIRQDDLRFTAQEAETFLHSIMELELSPEEMAALERRTEGWIAGLQLAALSMRGQKDAQAFIREFTGSNRYILDYLIDEVFTQQPAETQEFLLKTSILERLSGPLCDAISGHENSSDLLQVLEQANLFIIPLDQNREWYRYHHLFGDLLRYQLRALDVQVETELNQRACQWYAGEGFLTDAIHHALAGKDWGTAARLIDQASEEMLRLGEITLLLSWYGRLPQQVVRAQAQLCLSYAWALMLASQLEAAEPLLICAEQAAPAGSSLLGEVAAAQAYMAQSLGDGRRMIEASQQALALLPETDLHSRGIVSLNLGIAYWHIGRMEDTHEVLQQAIPALHQRGNFYGEMAARIFQARVLAVRGQIRPAATYFEEITRQTGRGQTFPLVFLDLCTLYYEWNELETAASWLEQGLESCQRSGSLEFQMAAFMHQAWLAFALGDLAGVDEALVQIHQILESSSIPLRTRARVTDLEVQLALRQGDLETARSLEPQLTADAENHPFYRFLDLTPARLLLAQGRKEEAASKFAAAVKVAAANDWGYGLIAGLVLQALAADTSSAALEFLGQALSMAEPQGFIRTFADAGAPLAPLLQEAARRGLYPEYAGQILAAIGEKPRADAAASALVEPLSERELEVLRLVAAGLSNRQIAQQLVVSLGTAKTHIHNIYGKLGASSRVQAIARARELDLF